ncbi:Mu transposase domain-containing protein [Nocardia sp. NPDC052278]|uniref:Mu transposase domain-containing protein n=1 Tax=unclassified Nocardia TaxID=2637762 RepID=UPI0036915DE2
MTERLTTHAPALSSCGPAEVFIPQTHRPGAEAEVDFGDFSVRLRGETVTCYLFSFRMSFSGKAVHRVFASGGQEAFPEGHVHAFTVLGGVPFGKVRYDNLKIAVAQVLGFHRLRKETERWTAFRSHFDLESFYCQPGIEGAHEKGGVEGDIGWFRRNRLVPVPEVDSLEELNAKIDAWDAEHDARHIGARSHTVGEHFAIERKLLKPLPEEGFETGSWFSPRVDRYSQVVVRTNWYSVPARLIGRQVRVLLHASFLIVYDDRVEVARHERLVGRGRSRLDLDHYLEARRAAPWVQPAPDRWLLPPGADPAETTVLHDSVRLAFVAALQHLTPLQRAALILRDVLKLTADETADLLEITAASANGLLRRARRRLADRRTQPAPPVDLTDEQRTLLERFVDAFQRHDVPVGCSQ